MKQKMLIIGISLITAFLLIGSASAATVIGHGSKIVKYGHGATDHDSWVTYEYSQYKVKTVVTDKAYLYGKYCGTITYTNTITKASNSKVKLVSAIHAPGYKDSYTEYWYSKNGNALNFYKSKHFQNGYLKYELM